MRNRGFTLIELLVVIGVISVLATVVTVNYAGYRRTSQLDATAQQIISTLRDAQSRSVAAKEEASYGVYFLSNPGGDDQYFLFRGNSYATGTILETFTVPSILNLSAIDFSGLSSQEVVFDRLTGRTANFGYVTVSLSNPTQDKIIAVNSEGQIAEVAAVPVFPDIPGSFNLETPTKGTIVSSLTPTFTWTPAASAQSYTLWHSTDPNFISYTEITGITAHPTAPSYTLGVGEELTNSARNYWKVKAVGLEGERWSEEKDWYVNAGINDPPEPFYLLAPANGATETTTLNVSFDWEDTTDPNGHPLTYTLEYSEDSNFPAGGTTAITGISLSEYTLKPAEVLPNHTTVYWRVIAIDSLGGETIATDEATGDPFRNLVVAVNQAPEAFNLLTPVDGDTVATSTPTLDWEDAIDPDTPYTGDTVTYNLWYSTDPTFAAKTEITNLAVSEYTIATPLTENQTYYWRVRAQDNHGAVTWSSQLHWSFIYISSGPQCDWHVDQTAPAGGDGLSWATAFRTIGEAVSAMSGGQTACIADGNYAESNQLNSSLSGSAGAYTTFINRVGNNNVIISGGSYGFRLNGANYIKMEGLKFSGASENIRLQAGASNNVFTNIETSGGAMGIRIQSGSNSDNYFSNLLVQNHTNTGIYDRDTSGSVYENVQIRDNTGTYGFYASNSEKPLLEKMEIAGNNRGIYFTGTSGGIIRDSLIYKNSSYCGFNQVSGVEIYDNEFRDHLSNWALHANRSRGVVIRNNLFNGNSSNLYAVRSGSGTHIYNNTIYGNRGGDGLRLERFDGATKVRNNVLTNNSVGFRVTYGNANLNNDYADVWGNINNFWNEGAIYAGLNSISQDPLFVAPGSDFNLRAASPCINRGDPDPFYNDPDGSRSDIGAFPYTP